MKLAQVNDGSINLVPPGGFANLNSITIGGVVSFLVAMVMIIAGVIFFFMLVIGGIKWIMSGGDKGKTEEARNQITAALIGLIIVFAAWAIIILIQQIFGVNLLNFNIPNIV